MSIIVEDFDLAELLEKPQSPTPRGGTAMLFERRFPPQFQLDKLRRANPYASDENFQLVVRMLSEWNRQAQRGMMEGGWRRHYQTHLFMYNSLMTVMFQTSEVGKRNLRSLVDWLNAGRPCHLKPQQHPRTPALPIDTDEQVRLTFKSSLPASLEKMNKRRLFHDSSQLTTSSAKNSILTGLSQAAGSHADVRLYLSGEKELRRDRQQQELQSNREKIITTKSVLFEKARNSSLLWSQIKISKQKIKPSDQLEGLRKLKEQARQLQAATITRKYQALQPYRRRKSLADLKESVAEEVPVVQGLTLLTNPLIRRKQARLR